MKVKRVIEQWREQTSEVEVYWIKFEKEDGTEGLWHTSLPVNLAKNYEVIYKIGSGGITPTVTPRNK